MAILLGPRTRQTPTANTMPDLLNQARNVFEQTADCEIVVDFSSVETIGSRELNELIRLHLSVKEEGRHLIVKNAQDHLWHVFTVTRLDRLIDIRRIEPA